MNSRQIRGQPANRQGFSLIDLLVLVAIFAVLLALFAPAVRRARGPARRLECKNNMKNIALAIRNFRVSHGDRFPSIDEGGRNWAIAILPEFDEDAVYQQIVRQGADPRVCIRSFTCPEDAKNFEQDNGLSYVVNGGYANWPSGTTNSAKTRASGVFFTKTNGRSVTGKEINEADGATHTIMLMEQTRRGSWRFRSPVSHFVRVDVNQIGVAPCSAAGPATVIIPGSMDASVLGSLRLDGVNTACMSGLNGSRASYVPASIQGRAPSSNHIDIVHMAFCDGRSQGVSEQIYAQDSLRLITYNGMNFRQLVVDDKKY